MEGHVHIRQGRGPGRRDHHGRAVDRDLGRGLEHRVARAVGFRLRAARRGFAFGQAVLGLRIWLLLSC